MAQSPVVGIDIGSQLMKAVELHVSSKEGIAITGMAVAPTPAGVIQGGMLTDPQLMAHAVKQMLKDAGIKHKKVIGCIAGQSSVVVRIIEVPRMTPGELAETMKWEVERHVPFAPTEVQMDYQPLPIQDDQDANNPNMSVLLAVAQKDMVNYYVDMLFKAGLDPVAIDIEPLAAGRALLDIENGLPVVRPLNPMDMSGAEMDSSTDIANQPPKETVAVVNIGAANTDISIFEDGMLIFPRSLALAGESLTKAIADGMGYQVDQAERLKIEHGQVLMDRLNEYATGGYQGDTVEFPYGQPEEDFGNLRPIGLPDSGPLGSSPFDSGPLQRSPLDSSPLGGSQPTSDRIASGPLGAPIVPGSGPTGFSSAGALDLERTQPIQRRTLDLARRGPGAGFSSTGFDTAAGAPPAADADAITVQIFDAILPVLSELATELRRSLDYYRSRAAGKNVDRVILCGGTASLPGLDRFLDQELQVPVQVASPFAGLSVTTKSFDPRYLQTIAPLFTVAVGLASRNAVFAANPLPVVKKAKGPGLSGLSGLTSGAKGKFNISMPSLPTFGGKGGKKTSKVGGRPDSTTLPPTG